VSELRIELAKGVIELQTRQRPNGVGAWLILLLLFERQLLKQLLAGGISNLAASIE
jgi:hypothetical protein